MLTNINTHKRRQRHTSLQPRGTRTPCRNKTRDDRQQQQSTDQPGHCLIIHTRVISGTFEATTHDEQRQMTMSVVCFTQTDFMKTQRNSMLENVCDNLRGSVPTEGRSLQIYTQKQPGVCNPRTKTFAVKHSTNIRSGFLQAATVHLMSCVSYPTKSLAAPSSFWYRGRKKRLWLGLISLC